MIRKTLGAVLVLATLTALATEAQAVLYSGNPKVGFRVDRPAGDYLDGTVDLDKVRVHHCASGYTDYSIDETIDPVEGYELTISGGNHCAVTWYWDNTMEIDGDGSQGTFTVEYTGSSVTVTLDTEIDPEVLTPWSVTAGTMAGGGPWILTYVE